MSQFEKLYNFENLYKAHKVARLGKRGTREVIDFEMNLAENLSRISESIRNKTYKMSGYYSFHVYDPKKRKIHALHYIDRVVQHCLCDEVLVPLLDKRLIYDNAACRKNKGTHFALSRMSGFLKDFYNKNGTEGYFLKCDIKKFFDNIQHDVLKDKLRKVINDSDLLWILDMIIDSYETEPGKGIPLGNQTSQWFAVYYLDCFDRLIKEQMKIRYYSRYMDDCVLIHKDKEFLKDCLRRLEAMLEEELFVSFNSKTQIFPLRNGVNYLGFHFYLTESGKVVRKVKQQTKYKYKRKLKWFEYAYGKNQIQIEEIKQVLASYRNHLSFGHTYKLQKNLTDSFVLVKHET